MENENATRPGDNRDLAGNALAIREATEEAKALQNLPAEVKATDWGAITEIETTDLLVPKIYHQQNMSKFVSDGLAKPGDFCDSLTGQVLARKDDKLEIIVFGLFKTMVVSKMAPGDKQYKLDAVLPVDKANAVVMAKRPYFEEVDGVKVKNSLTHNFYVLLPDHINELPYVLSLASTKAKAAKKLATLLYKLDQTRRPSAACVFELTSVPEKNDQGSWFGLAINQGRWSKADELLRAHAWALKSQEQNFIVEEEPAPDTGKEPWDND